ncbi:MAG: prolyl oligopeptidase family serine peptidase [Bacteroidales bacterium]|jgi:dipeptidyl aminopeptidase/acylaminoacyl peptidase|nr:prolyl oligopeptidase family serine peptidase [Bacteroidales bacterium]
MKKVLSLIILITIFGCGIIAQDALKYQKPPGEIVEIMTASPTPSVSISPDGTTIALTERPGMPSIEDLSQEELRLGGLRIDPAVNGPSRRSYANGISLMNIDGTDKRELKGLPSNLKMGGFSWSNDGSKFAFTNTTANSIELWVGDVESLEVKRVDDNLNMVIGYRGFSWLPDNKSILYQTVIPGRGERPEPSPVPVGPVVQENLGKKGAARTFQDLLENPVDEAIFAYFAGSVIKVWNGSSARQIGKPGIYSSVNPSPDGKYLLVETVEKPFSYTVPYYYFPSDVAIWDMDGNVVKLLAELPLKENLPRGYDMTFPEPSGFTWRNDRPSTVLWVEHLDGGDFEKEMEYHDQVYILDAPFDGEAREYLATALRFGGITWGNDDVAIFSERSRKERLSVQSMFDPDDPMGTKKEIFRLQSEDRYNDPGNFVTTENEAGQRVLLFDKKGRSLYLRGSGASPEGDRPFLDEYRIKDGKITRLWRSEAPWYENVADILADEEDLVITTRESVDIPPNYFIRNLKNGKLTQITSFDNPYPQLEGVSKEMVKYTRNDGLDLSFDLYLPAGYDREKDGPLPAIMWAYPREYQSQDAAGQVSGSPYRFIRVSPSSILVFVTQGYAIMNNAAFPIVAQESDEPNDTFREQLVANAQAAIDKGVEMGVVDPDRVAVGGHSYGAFMTANLLAHSRLFAAGIARSGAYNRTLTPFGFQNERRSFWEAPDLYFYMSPFMHAEKVKDPILLIHGQADNNSGTFPLQSERYYAALKGHGATVRLVMLPQESHGYSSAESLMHMQWETYRWLEKYVKEK